MTNKAKSHLRGLLRPLIHLMLRNGVSYADFAEMSASVYVEVAGDEEEFCLPGRKQTTSRISVLTDINRKEVKKLREAGADFENVSSNRLVLLVGGWAADEEFQDDDGQPLMLTFGAGATENSFENLAKKYSGDLSARSILDELVSAQSVEWDQSAGQVKLVSKAYVPVQSSEELLSTGANQIRHMIDTVNFNFLAHKMNVKNDRLQLEVEHKVKVEMIPLFRKLAKQRSMDVLNDLNEWLHNTSRALENDRDEEDDEKYKAGLGIYYFQEKIE